MRYSLFIIFTLIAISTSAQDQKYRLFDFYEGYIITNDGNKERGYIQHLDESDRYEKVIFKKELKGKKQKFKFGDIKGYKVADTEYKAVEFADVVFKGRKFLIVDEINCISTYHYREYDNEDGAWQTITVLENEEGAVNYQKLGMKFAKNLSEFLKNDNEIAQKVLNKEKGYRLIHMFDIINEYNENCNKKD